MDTKDTKYFLTEILALLDMLADSQSKEVKKEMRAAINRLLGELK